MKRVAKTEKLTFRVTPKMKTELEQLSADKGISMAALVLNYISNGILQDKALAKLVTPESMGKIINQNKVFEEAVKRTQGNLELFIEGK